MNDALKLANIHWNHQQIRLYTTLWHHYHTWPFAELLDIPIDYFRRCVAFQPETLTPPDTAPFGTCIYIYSLLVKNKNQTNHPMSSNNHSLSTTYKAKYCLKWEGGGVTKQTGSSYNFNIVLSEAPDGRFRKWQERVSDTNPFLKLVVCSRTLHFKHTTWRWRWRWNGCWTSELTIFQSYMWRHIDVQADWRRSRTYGRAPNAIDIP